ncbi:MAG: polysaccharide biosynthesis C-terminal domain-containing protein [Clostridia bacterium]|nr:polysaccharide biosynthesis C-terminal domain-containing protein [Clostridia bacterium]
MIRDLTQGKPEQVLRQFTLPLFISVIFQQFYNMADTAIIGRFAEHGEDAVAAIGASHPITMIFMAVAIGSSIGCSVVISQLFGGRQFARMKTAITTTLTACAGLSLLLSALGLALSPALLRLVDTPENIFADAGVYLNIYIGGFIFLFLYNVCNGMFTSLGDSRTPLYFLIGSSLGNIVLDWFFVAVLHLDVAGVAWATFIAQGSAAILAFVALLRRLRTIECAPHPFFSNDDQKVMEFMKNSDVKTILANKDLWDEDLTFLADAIEEKMK